MKNIPTNPDMLEPKDETTRSIQVSRLNAMLRRKGLAEPVVYTTVDNAIRMAGLKHNPHFRKR